MIKFVTGEMGQYNRAKKKNGKQIAHTAPSPYGLPRPSPAEMYLCGVEKEPGKKSLGISDIPHDKHPMKVLTILATNPNVVSP